MSCVHKNIALNQNCANREFSKDISKLTQKPSYCKERKEKNWANPEFLCSVFSIARFSQIRRALIKFLLYLRPCFNHNHFPILAKCKSIKIQIHLQLQDLFHQQSIATYIYLVPTAYLPIKPEKIYITCLKCQGQIIAQTTL